MYLEPLIYYDHGNIAMCVECKIEMIYHQEENDVCCPSCGIVYCDTSKFETFESFNRNECICWIKNGTYCARKRFMKYILELSGKDADKFWTPSMIHSVRGRYENFLHHFERFQEDLPHKRLFKPHKGHSLLMILLELTGKQVPEIIKREIKLPKLDSTKHRLEENWFYVISRVNKSIEYN